MGSWDETCGLSNMPIREGDEIVLHILGKNMMRNNRKGLAGYRPDFYAPMSLAFHGVYDDYGSIILDESKSEYHEKVFSYLHHYLHTFTRVDHEKDLLKFLRDVERGNLHDLNSIMFKKSAYDLFNGISGDTKDYPSGTYKENKTRDLADIISNLPDTTGMSEYERMKALMSFNPDVERIPFVLGQEMNYLVKQIITNGEVVSSDVQEEIVLLSLTNLSLDALRRGWMPSLVNSHQYDTFDLYGALSDYITNESRRHEESINSDYYEEDIDSDD